MRLKGLKGLKGDYYQLLIFNFQFSILNSQLECVTISMKQSSTDGSMGVMVSHV